MHTGDGAAETVNPFKPEIAIVIFIHYTTSRKLLSQFSTCSGWWWLEFGGQHGEN